MQVEAYYSQAMKSWVRMVKQADNEWCHTSGYATREEALGLPARASTDKEWVHPCDKEVQHDIQ